MPFNPTCFFFLFLIDASESSHFGSYVMPNAQVKNVGLTHSSTDCRRVFRMCEVPAEVIGFVTDANRQLNEMALGKKQNEGLVGIS